MATINKQPLFAGTINLITKTFDPPIMINHYEMNSSWTTPPESVYTANGSYGDIVDRITISATGDSSNTNISAKLIYIYLFDSQTELYSLYKTLSMPETTVSDTNPNPELELVFQGGLLLKKFDKIYIGASTNRNYTGRNGDYISVTVEGGTYDAQS